MEDIVLERLLSDKFTRMAVPKSGSGQEMVCKVALNDITTVAAYRELQCLITVNSAASDMRETPASLNS